MHGFFEFLRQKNNFVFWLNLFISFHSEEFLMICSYPYSIFDNKEKGSHLLLLNKKTAEIKWQYSQTAMPISQAFFKDEYLYLVCPKEILIFKNE